MQFCIKIKNVLLRSRNRLPRNTLVSICFKNFKSQCGVPNWPFFQNVENACNENLPTLNICWGGSHKCMNHDDDNELLGVDVVKIRDDYENCRKDKFHCEKCEYFSTKMEEVKNHFIINHEKKYSCWECEGNLNTIVEFKKHYGSFHYTEEEISDDST